MVLIDNFYANKCACGWWFPALNESVKKCSQCRDIVMTCDNCGCEIDGLITKRYCETCAKLNRRIIDKYERQNRKKYYRDTIDKQICNYDCANCKFSDCILPVDDAKQGELW